MDDSDLDLLTLWAAATHLAVETYTSPRLVIDSPVPGSGKTTCLEHLERLCFHPVQMASLSSPALLVRMLDKGLRTILIDEADRSLNPDMDGVGELLAILNSGYKRGGTRPVLTPVKGGGWDAVEMSTYSPVAMAGNNPNLPDDTRSRSIRVLLMPDINGEAEDSDWEMNEAEVLDIAEHLRDWVDTVRDMVRENRPPLPVEIRGRAKERWFPLKRVAAAAGGQWPDLVDQMAVRDIRRIEIEREEGIMQEKPAIVLLRHICEVWEPGATFTPTEHLLYKLIDVHPDAWDVAPARPKALTAQRMGRMLVNSFNIHSARPDTNGKRGYVSTDLDPVLRRFGMTLPGKPDEPADLAELDGPWTAISVELGATEIR
ncbi:hypothetical protein JOF29_007946 [Kribbella aluminosa]|uniref:DUF3631 domain-containing protein n=1 Tax=Kribbella aluminosa TaxID=416017 RepID=A0ABS4UYV6_9ACTN|nr:DUF3631 domain-containing protein [Kribbella aluminosa]MBP2356836.1 hypothetical protein [Kribbella aluminosa]